MENIDIILPNYNSHESLKKTLNSIFNQTFKKWKIIIIDDNSDLETKKILETYKKFKKVKIFYLKKNKGAGYCRNFGIKKSKAKYIAFIDSDDTWEKSKLEKQLNFIKKKNINFSYTWYKSFKNKTNYNKKIKTPLKFNFDNFTKNTSIATSTIIIKRSLTRNIKFLNTRVCEDYFYKCQLLKKTKFAYCIPLFLTKYQIRKNSLQSNKLRNLFWVWKINQKYNKFNFFRNILSVFMISINSLKKYGYK